MAEDRAVDAGPSPLVAGSLAVTLLSLTWLGTNWFHPWSPSLLGWVFPLLSAAIATVAARRAGTTVGIAPAARRFWRTGGAAALLIVVALLSNAWDAVGTPGAPTQAISGRTLGLYVAGMIVTLWALLRLPGTARPGGPHRGRFLLDASAVVITTGLLGWHVAFRNIDDWAGTAASGATVLSTVLLASVAVLTLMKLAVAGVGAVDRRALHLLAIAAAVGAAGGAAAPLMAGHPHVSDAHLTVPLTMLVFTLAADSQRRAAGRNGTPATGRRPFSLVPYAAVAVTDGLLLAATARAGDGALVVAIGAVALTGVVVVRQISAAYDIAGLLRRVDATDRELRAVRGQLAHQAHHDELTGLANRRLLEERIRQAVADGLPASVVLIDLDDFKAINDRLGHVMGDALLVIVGDRMRACVRVEDTVARLGGDEFALLLVGISAIDADTVLRRVGTALDEPVRVGPHDLLVGSSMGLADAWRGADPTELLRRADLAMYAAKEQGKGRQARYEPALDARAASDAQLGADLRQALERGEFHLLFQPVVRLPEGRPVGAEALVRWQHPERGLIRPDAFIGAAERTGLIVPLGAWILREACTRAAEWLHGYGATQPWRISVNISARQLREPGFAAHVDEALRATGLPAGRLMVEVTETAVFDNGPAVEALTQISDLGVAVALDDFGTGHSSLGLLRTTPVNVLKVDKSFVDGITGGSEEVVIASAMIRLAEGLHLGAVAEGVETPAQADRLHELGYGLAQGYYFARPLPAARVGELLAAEADRQPARHRTGPPARRSGEPDARAPAGSAPLLAR
ncbi:MAG TPA: bifunctional diguanylate cyclase/phosphodiesterase, partial [Pilimelia sp.]|nr:bifunctional diguanylate cyclase/phosphodiesterase [Pilimelia sp.]